MVRKDAARDSQGATGSSDTIEPRQQQQQPGQQAFPAVAPSTVVNIALHSLLMVTVPFALFFTAHFGGFDCEWCWKQQCC